MVFRLSRGMSLDDTIKHTMKKVCLTVLESA